MTDLPPDDRRFGALPYDEILVTDPVSGESVPMDTLGRPNRPADARQLAEWETRTFSKLRRDHEAPTPFDDELPDDPLADLEETRSALSRLGSA